MEHLASTIRWSGALQINAQRNYAVYGCRFGIRKARCRKNKRHPQETLISGSIGKYRSLKTALQRSDHRLRPHSERLDLRELRLHN